MKKILLFFVLFSVTISLSACGSNNQSTGEKKAEVKTDSQGRRMPDFGQPEKTSDIRGLVTKVVGNEVTVLKIERPEGFEERSNTEDSDESEEKKSTTLGTGSTRMPGMGMGRMGGGNRGDMDADAILEKMKEMGGEEVTVTIPVGIQMLMPDETEGDKPNMIEASLSDVEKDKMINIWLNDEVLEKQVASFVMIMK